MTQHLNLNEHPHESNRLDSCYTNAGVDLATPCDTMRVRSPYQVTIDREQTILNAKVHQHLPRFDNNLHDLNDAQLECRASEVEDKTAWDMWNGYSAHKTCADAMNDMEAQVVDSDEGQLLHPKNGGDATLTGTSFALQPQGLTRIFLSLTPIALPNGKTNWVGVLIHVFATLCFVPILGRSFHVTLLNNCNERSTAILVGNGITLVCCITIGIMGGDRESLGLTSMSEWVRVPLLWHRVLLWQASRVVNIIRVAPKRNNHNEHSQESTLASRWP